MKEPIISDLKGVTEDMIDALKTWLADELHERCPFSRMSYSGVQDCHSLFENLGKNACSCSFFGQDATILAFTIICDVWKGYHKRG